MRRQKALLCAFGVALVFGVAACSGKNEEPAPATLDDLGIEASGDVVTGGDLRVGLRSLPNGWDPTRNVFGNAEQMAALTIFDRLMAYDPQGTPQPHMAESIETNDDFTTWTITLRDDIEFHDGTPLDADAVVANFEARLALPLNALDFVDGVEATDARTVVVTMSEPWATFPHVLTSQIGYMMAPAMMADENGFERPIGTGPFRLESFEPGQSLAVVANESYWRDGLPYVDRVDFTAVPDTVERARLVRTDGLDLIELDDAALITSFVESASAGEDQLFFDRDGERFEALIALNTSVAPFDDLTARRFLAAAVDTDKISTELFGGLFEPARGPFHRDSEWYVDTGYPEHDPVEAQRLADAYEAEHGEPLDFSVTVSSGSDLLAVAQELVDQLGPYGVTVTVTSVAENAVFLELFVGNFEAAVINLFGAEHHDREYMFVHSADLPVTFNFTRMTNPIVDDGLDAARATDDRPVQVLAYNNVQSGLAEDLRFIWLVHKETAIAAGLDVRGVTGPTLADGRPALEQEGALIQLAEVWLTHGGR